MNALQKPEPWITQSGKGFMGDFHIESGFFWKYVVKILYSDNMGHSYSPLMAYHLFWQHRDLEQFSQQNPIIRIKFIT
jgi:hypothetical protein